jgi:hypothetical protein
MLLIVILLVIAGWLRWPWWTPVGVFVLSAGLRIWNLHAIGVWQSHEDPHTLWLFVGINFATTIILYLLGYWAGRGVARMMGDSGSAL